MRKNNIFFIAAGLIMLLIFSYGCAKERQKRIALRINDFIMTEEELEEEIRKSEISDSPSERQKFLEDLINRKLILQEAEHLGLDKEREFLKAVERFWEQSLLKIMIDRKSKEIAGQISVTDREIEKRYNEMLEQGTVNKPLSESYNEIKWQVLRNKQTQALNAWVEGLRRKAKVEIKSKILDAKEPE